MNIEELIELRCHQHDEISQSTDDFYRGYACGWGKAYDDIRAILEHYGFDMEQEVKK